MSEEVKDITIDAGGKRVSLNPGLFINNKFVPSVSGKKFATIDPASGREIAEIYEADAADVDVAVKAAEAAYYGGWNESHAQERARLLFKVADLMLQPENFDALARVEALDNGKTYEATQTIDVNRCISAFRYYAGWADKIHGKTVQSDPDKFAYTRHEPIGVCGGIIPWNFPLVMLSWKIAPAIACGNCVILKSSEKTPLTALMMARLIQEAGFPPGVINIISGYGPTAGNAISSHMRIRKVAFTGSIPTGKKVMKAAAESNLKHVSLEMGGKSPNIVFPDADVEQAVKWAIRGVYANMGQVCCAGTRVFVHEDVYDQFIKEFAKAAKNVTYGDQFSKSTTQGPIVDKIQFKKILNYIKSGVDEGATLEAGGKRHGTEGYFIEPTLFTNVRSDMKIVREEIFGPVGVAIKFKTEEEVIRIANDTEYGLAAAVFTRDIQRAIRVSNKLEAGVVWVNCYLFHDITTAFGGYKQSGLGREKSDYALELWTQVKQVIVYMGSKL